MARPEPRLKPWILFVLPATLVLLVAVLAYFTEAPTDPPARRHPIAYSEFKMLVEQGNVEEVVLRGEAVEGTLRAPAPIGRDGEPGVLFGTRVPSFGDEALLPALSRERVRVRVAEAPEGWWPALRPWLPTLLLIALFLWIFSRASRSLGGGLGPGGDLRVRRGAAGRCEGTRRPVARPEGPHPFPRGTPSARGYAAPVRRPPWHYSSAVMVT